MMRRGERNDGVKSYSENILALVCPLSLRTPSPRLNFVRISQGQAAESRVLWALWLLSHFPR